MNKDPEKKFWDFSTLHKDHPLYDATSKNELGLFKLETSDFIVGLVGARPKVYSIETIPYEDFEKMIKKGPFCVKKYQKKMVSVKRLKGVKKHIIRNHFNHQSYKSAVIKQELTNVSYFTISSRQHNVSTDFKSKLALSRYVHCYIVKISNSREKTFTILTFFIYSFYDKRYVHQCRIHTTPLNHYRIKNRNFDCMKCEKFGKYVDICS